MCDITYIYIYILYLNTSIYFFHLPNNHHLLCIKKYQLNISQTHRHRSNTSLEKKKRKKEQRKKKEDILSFFSDHIEEGKPTTNLKSSLNMVEGITPAPHFSLSPGLDPTHAQLLHCMSEVIEKCLLVGGVKFHEWLRSGVGD